MSLYDIVICLCAVLLFIIATVRLNDLRREWNSKRWWVRRCGFLMVMVGSGGTVASYFTLFTPHWYEIVRLLMYGGVALAWITTPNQPPFWKYIARRDPPAPVCTCSGSAAGD